MRFDDGARTLSLSVGELVKAGPPRGHLTRERMVAGRARLAAGQWVHETWQTAREAEMTGFTREVRVRLQRVVQGWTVDLQGRVDGLIESEGTWTIEEVKSTALDGMRLAHCGLEDWPDYQRQLQIYLWMLSLEHPAHHIRGVLALVSLADSSRRLFDVELDDALEVWVDDRLQELIATREDHLAWMAVRPTLQVDWPHSSVREGQQDIVTAVGLALDARTPLLVEAPTGLGKTVSVLMAAVQHALRTGKQVFWATTRTTQQPVVEKTLSALRAQGAPLRAVFLNARTKVCANEEAPLDCRPEACRFAEGYFERIRERRVLHGLRESLCTRSALEGASQQHTLCPYQLARDLTPMVDVVVGDTNYVFDPTSRLKKAFDDEPEQWIVICDEAHQLIERARAYRSPRLDARQAQEAGRFLESLGSDFAPFAFLARQIEDAIVEAQHQVVGPVRGSEGVAELSEPQWIDLLDRVEELEVDYALLKAALPDVHEDPWLMLTWQLQRFCGVLQEMEEESVAIVSARPEGVRICCLDPSSWIGPRILKLGGFVAASATLNPASFHRDLLGIQAEHLAVASPFPPENLTVLVDPRISTSFKDRISHAPATAELIDSASAVVPGNVAVFFPSFGMLESITGRLDGPKRLICQQRGMDDASRTALLATLSDGVPTLLAAVLGGVFAEGIDLPPGALDAVFICGPAYPPVGLERDLLRHWCDDRYDAGLLYSSLVPGLTRVVQAAGRLIRRPEDRGAILLIGRRFRWRDVAALLPERWDPHVSDDVPADLQSFFADPILRA